MEVGGQPACHIVIRLLHLQSITIAQMIATLATLAKIPNVHYSPC